jgi:hypothetical protein
MSMKPIEWENASLCKLDERRRRAMNHRSTHLVYLLHTSIHIRATYGEEFALSHKL